MAFAEYVVGKFYEVPCVRVGDLVPLGVRRNGWIPILLPFHEDKEILQFPLAHYHYDSRFLPKDLYHQFYLGLVVTRYPADNWKVDDEMTMIEDRRKAFFTGEVVYRRLKCKRQMLSFYLPQLTASNGWPARLEAAYANDHLRKGVCPHKGIDLSSCPVVGGTVTCPGHGLRWNVETGKMIRQMTEEETS